MEQVVLKSGRTIGRLGLGTYHGAADPRTDQAYEAVLYDGIAAGCTMIDIAPHYRGGRSLALVGRMVKQAAAIVPCCKLGFVPDDDRRIAVLLEAGVAPGAIKADHHCLDPAYLAFEFDRVAKVLGADRMPIVLLHNPEEMFRYLPRAQALEILQRAFLRLEDLAATGRIEVYGIATTRALCVASDHMLALVLADLVRMAESIAGHGHHFGVIQVPFSLALRDALEGTTQMVQGEWLSVRDACRRLGITPIFTSPLAGGAVLQLAARPDAGLDADDLAQAALDWVFRRTRDGIVVLGTTQRPHLQSAVTQMFAAP